MGSRWVPSGFSLPEGESYPPPARLINDVLVSLPLLARCVGLGGPIRGSGAMERAPSVSPVCVRCFVPDIQDARVVKGVVILVSDSR